MVTVFPVASTVRIKSPSTADCSIDVPTQDPVVATKLSLNSLARRILDITDEIAELDRFIVPLVEELAPSLLELEGVGTENAGAVMVAVGDNPDRLRSEASFAMMCGVCPIPASSGKTQRHRLNRGGNRQANSALHMVVVSYNRILCTALKCRRRILVIVDVTT